MYLSRKRVQTTKIEYCITFCAQYRLCTLSWKLLYNFVDDEAAYLSYFKKAVSFLNEWKMNFAWNEKEEWMHTYHPFCADYFEKIAWWSQ